MEVRKMLSQEKIDLIRKLYLEGKTKTEITKITGSGNTTIKKYVQDIDEERKNEMIGQTFGQLTVLSLAPKRKDLANRCLRYICQCSCGNIIEVNGNSLRTGHTTSCGCSRQGANIKDLTGQRFGLLTVQDLAYINDDRRAVWNCRCDCGNITQVSSHGLLGGHNISCGCLHRSIGEIKIEKILSEMNLNYCNQYRINDCKYKKTLPFDFAIFDNNNQLVALIEYQGDIHFKITGGWNTEEELQARQSRDEAKRQYCKKHNIKLIEIPYTDYDILNEKYLRKAIYD